MKNPNPDTCPDYIPGYRLYIPEDFLEIGEHKGSIYRRHPNGGGWVDDAAEVEPSVQVTQNATVRGLSRITGTVIVSGDSVVIDSVIYGGDGEKGIQVVDSIVDRSELDRDDSMPADRLSVISASVLHGVELMNPPIIHDEAIRNTRG